MSTPSVVFYTSCPIDYDGFGTVDTGAVAFDGRGREIRRVLIAPQHYDWQINRYYSGAIYFNAGPDDFRKSLDYGLITAAP
jgi:hypothetical protein